MGRNNGIDYQIHWSMEIRDAEDRGFHSTMLWLDVKDLWQDNEITSAENEDDRFIQNLTKT